MEFGDYSPPEMPSLDQQRDALQKRLGRAMQWAHLGRLDDEPLLEACLRDQRYDQQVEASRGEWTWRLLQATGAAVRLRVPLLHACHKLSDERSTNQLCEIAGKYAMTGDIAFRSYLYEIVEKKPFADRRTLGEVEIIELDGVEAFHFAVSVRGRGLSTREWDWDDSRLIEVANHKYGTERVAKVLEDSIDPSTRTFLKGWLQSKVDKDERSTFESRHEAIRSISANEVISLAESADSSVGVFRGWGMQAAPEDLQTVAERLWVTQQPAAIVKLLRVFSNRALPLFDQRLIDLSRHTDDAVQRWAFSALEQNTHPDIRRFAVSELERGEHDSTIIRLFANNFEIGDEHYLLDIIDLPSDPDELHYVLMGLNAVLKKNAQADASKVPVIVYAKTPCSHCRRDALQLLINQNAVPTWMKEECMDDSDEGCREAFVEE